MRPVECTIGILVGGRSRRMGGVAKGMLFLPGETERVAERLLRVTRSVGHKVILVGNAEAYASLGCDTIEDAPTLGYASGAGPLAGVVALLVRADRTPAIALACDLPYVSAEIVRRLAFHESTAPAIAPRQSTAAGRRWEPLFARFDPKRVLPTAQARLALGKLSLQGLLDEVGAEEFPLATDDWTALRDWDRPADIAPAVNRSNPG